MLWPHCAALFLSTFSEGIWSGQFYHSSLSQKDFSPRKTEAMIKNVFVRRQNKWVTSDDLAVRVENGRRGSVSCSELCCGLLALQEVNGTFLLPDLFCLTWRWRFPSLGGCEVKLMFIKICDIFGRKFHSKMYELLLILCWKEIGMWLIGTDPIYSSLWRFFESFVLFIIYW